MNPKNKRYVIAFDSTIYPSNNKEQNEIPDKLRESLENGGASIAFYSSERNFISAYIPNEKVDEIKCLEGIIGVAIEPRYA